MGNLKKRVSINLIQAIKFAKKKHAKIWSGNHLDFTFEKKDKSEKFIGTKGNNFISPHFSDKQSIAIFK